MDTASGTMGCPSEGTLVQAKAGKGDQRIRKDVGRERRMGWIKKNY